MQPVPGGNIPVTQAAIELKLTFKEGGAPDFHSNLERIKERLQQVVSTARENNLTGSRQDSFLGNVNLDNVHLDELPSYQESGHHAMAPPEGSTEAANRGGGGDAVASPLAMSPQMMTAELRRAGSPVAEAGQQPPSDAPPGYEETQQQSIQAELDRRLSQHQD